MEKRLSTDAMEDIQEAELRAYYSDIARHLVIKGLIGFAVGVLFALFTTISDGHPFSFINCCSIGLFFAGIPYGYELLGNIIGRWYVVGNIAIMLLSFALKLVGAILIGWIAYPIALLYNLVRATRKGSILRIVFIVLLCIVFAIIVLFWGMQIIGAFHNDSKPNDDISANSTIDEIPVVTFSDGSEAVWMTSADEVKVDSPEYMMICEDALSKTEIMADKEIDYGYEITSLPELHIAYFLKVKDPNKEHWDYGDDVKMKNAIIIVSSYGVNILNTVTRDEYFTWVYPNCIVSDSGEFEYNMELVYEDNLIADGVDGVYDWLCEEYSDMDIYPLVLPK